MSFQSLLVMFGLHYFFFFDRSNMVVVAQPNNACAHVVGVSVTEEDKTMGVYTFDTSVLSTETGWDKFADKWRIVDKDTMEILGTRDLGHPHVEEQPFTRSLTGVVIPTTVQSIFVEAQDSVLGYCGDIIVLTRDTTTTDHQWSVGMRTPRRDNMVKPTPAPTLRPPKAPTAMAAPTAKPPTAMTAPIAMTAPAPTAMTPTAMTPTAITPTAMTPTAMTPTAMTAPTAKPPTAMTPPIAMTAPAPTAKPPTTMTAPTAKAPTAMAAPIAMTAPAPTAKPPTAMAAPTAKAPTAKAPTAKPPTAKPPTDHPSRQWGIIAVAAIALTYAGCQAAVNHRT